MTLSAPVNLYHDYSFYANYMRSTRKLGEGSVDGVNAEDLLCFQKFIMNARVDVDFKSHFTSQSSADRGNYDGYKRWLTNGRFTLQTMRPDQ